MLDFSYTFVVGIGIVVMLAFTAVFMWAIVKIVLHITKK